MTKAYRFRGLIIERNGDEYSRECVVAAADIERASELARGALRNPFWLFYWSIWSDDFEAMQIRDGEVRCL